MEEYFVYEAMTRYKGLRFPVSSLFNRVTAAPDLANYKEEQNDCMK